jgi:hypothetical protein
MAERRMLIKHRYFNAFEGYNTCNITTAADLYVHPPRNDNGQYNSNAFCSTRKDLLQSMSGGGRLGFDAPYVPAGKFCFRSRGKTLRQTNATPDCHYNWYTTAQICMILERFDDVILIGDSTLQTIYNGFNILLRQDLSTGALKSWEMTPELLQSCRCDNQFRTPSCAKYFIVSSDEVNENTPSLGSAYACSRYPHTMIPITGPASRETKILLQSRMLPAPRTNAYRAIPIIHSLAPGSTTLDAATDSLLEIEALADASKRKTPMLWIGPTAAGHIEIKGRKGNQEIWDFDAAMAAVARKNYVDVLKLWNMTVQANSFDGLRFGEKVAITQAMMVINWLSRLESS